METPLSVQPTPIPGEPASLASPPSHHILTRKAKFQRDMALLAVSILVAVLLVVSGVADIIANQTSLCCYLGSFFAGIGFSSAFFAAPATVLIYEFAQLSPFWIVAILASLGAMIGDLIIFRFLRNGIADDFRYLVSHATRSERLRTALRSRLFYWFASFAGALIIASPLPDEIGLTIFGMLRYNTKRFLPISFAFNFLGIFIVTLIAQLPS